MRTMSVGAAAAHSGWSARMLRHLEDSGLVVPSRTAAGYRQYASRELNQLGGLSELRRRFGVELGEMRFALRLWREPELRAAVDTWLSGVQPSAAFLEWEQRKHERLLAA
jgi:MerR family transcriptional regulator, copper efflux regulator